MFYTFVIFTDMHVFWSFILLITGFVPDVPLCSADRFLIRINKEIIIIIIIIIIASYVHPYFPYLPSFWLSCWKISSFHVFRVAISVKIWHFLYTHF